MRQGVTKVAGKLSSLANGVMSSLQVGFVNECVCFRGKLICFLYLGSGQIWLLAHGNDYDIGNVTGYVF